MNMKFNSKLLARQGILAALYALLTFSGFGISYGPVQFRFSEVLTWFAFFDPKNIIGLCIGCFVANTISPYGIIDMLVGTFGTFIATYLMSKTKNKYLALICPALPSFLYSGQALILGEINQQLFPIVTLQIMLSQLIVTAIGMILMHGIIKNKSVAQYIVDQTQEPTKDSWIK